MVLPLLLKSCHEIKQNLKEYEDFPQTIANSMEILMLKIIKLKIFITLNDLSTPYASREITTRAKDYDLLKKSVCYLEKNIKDSL